MLDRTAGQLRSVRVSRTARVVTVSVMTTVLATGSTLLATTADAHLRAAALERARTAARVQLVVDAAADDARFSTDATTALRAAAGAALRSGSAAQADAAVAEADATLASATHAGEAERAALQAARDAVATAAATVGAGTSVTDVRRAVAALAAAHQVVAQAEQEWQAAEAARIAEAARVAEAARAAAASKAAAKPTRPAASGAQAAAPSAPATSNGPQGRTLTCQAGGSASSTVIDGGAIAAAINDYRAGLGLATLAVGGSGALAAHTQDMAAWGQIWHSGGDSIVGCVRPASATQLVVAWSNSPAHDAQMRRTDVTRMLVGAGTADGLLYGAVLFR